MAYKIVDVQTDPDLCRQRVAQRQGDASEADLKVLESQLAEYQPLSDEERKVTMVVSSSMG